MTTRLAALVLVSAALAAGAAPALADGPSSKPVTHKVAKVSPVRMQAAASTSGFRGRYQLRIDQAHSLLS